jgi:hypothetical protein
MIRRLTFLLALTFSPLPALAQFTCQSGDLITVHLLPRPFGGVDRCEPDPANPASPPLLCMDTPGLVRWKMSSLCQGKYTVLIEGDAFKANITGPAPCHLRKEYEKGVNDDQEMLCSLPAAGKFGYRLGVCLANHECAWTDPGIWVNRGATLEEYQAAEAEAKKISHGNEADFLKLSQRKQPPKKK